MFDDHQPCPERRTISNASINLGEATYTPSIVQEEEVFHGLCVNCENRHTCQHCRKVGGVWHCENYQ